MFNFNFFKFENNFNSDLFSSLNPLNFFKKRYTKDNVNILFIDDDDMPVVDNLKRSGYKVKKVRDIKNVDDAEVKNAQIIFVDFDGVGRCISPQHQGAGLVQELKTKYGTTKYVVLYTSQISLPTDTIIKLFNEADDRMRKDSDVTDFNIQIRKALSKIK